MASGESNKRHLYAGISGGKKLPFKPIEPISSKPESSSIAYFEAEYDRDGKLIMLTKYFGEEIEFVQTILYDGAEVVEIIIRDNAGKITRHVKK